MTTKVAGRRRRRMATLNADAETAKTVRQKLRRAADESGMTQEEIGLRMGFGKASARKAVSRLLNSEVEYDPRLSTLLCFAEAIGRPLKDLV
jgi:transcriptional regulator with XRE-family HTH domain